MAKKKALDEELETYIEWVEKHLAGTSTELVEELDAMMGFLHMLETQWKKDKDDRMCFLVSLVQSLTRIVGAQLIVARMFKMKND